MKYSLYFRLAVNGIRNNRKIYIPYIISGTGMVLMYYIIDALNRLEILKDMAGGGTLILLLSSGKYIIAAFALIFLLYTNSFLTKQRTKEFGVYSILGMDKRGLTGIISAESALIACLSVGSGLFCGILFSKLTELGLLRFIKVQADRRFTISLSSILMTLLIFGVIYFILYIKTVIKISGTTPLKLMNEQKQAEKPPKGNGILTISGLIMLIAAYIIVTSIKNPIAVIFVFLLAILLVIIATYFLFISGSVFICKKLQKDKKYYYKKAHFISISSMAYRMKRNGAGLGSICILSTMILVMIASSASLYFGTEDAMIKRYPKNSELSIILDSVTDAATDIINEADSKYENVFTKYNVKPENKIKYTYSAITGMQDGNKIDPDVSQSEFDILTFDRVRSLYFISCADYNRLMNADIKLSGCDILIKEFRCSFNYETIELPHLTLNVVGKADEFIDIGEANSNVIPSVFIVVSDLDILIPLEELKYNETEKMLTTQYYFGYDLSSDDEMMKRIFLEQKDEMEKFSFINTEEGYGYRANCIAIERSDFYETFGGLFFIGIILSILFIFAAAMIIYYKQISEGHEDAQRFDIMQKVGMTKKDIRKSINSQILTVFYMPLLLAGIHLCFAFVPIWKILQLFSLQNLPLVILVTFISFIIFGIIYALIYKLTAGAYYNIVSGADNYG